MSRRRRMLLGLFALAALGFGACSDGSKATVTPTLEPAPSNSTEPAAPVTAAPSPTQTLPNAVPLTFGDPVPFPPGVVIYARDPVWEGPTNAIRRYYRSPDGVLHDEVLLQSTPYFENQEQMRAISSTTLSPDGAEIAATLCHGTCYGGWQGVTVVASQDGGITWTEVGDLPGGGWVLATEAGKVLLVTPEMADTGRLVLLPGNESVLVDGYESHDQVFVPPAATGPEMLLWKGPGATIRRSGEADPWVVLPVPQRFQVLTVRVVSMAGRTPQVWAYFTVSGSGEYYEGLLDETRTRWERLFRARDDGGVRGFLAAGWLDDHTVLGRGDFMRSIVGAGPSDGVTGLPALLDVRTGVVSPIDEFLSFAPGKAGGPVPLALAKGTFLQVTGAGDCLNVRSEPGRDAPVLHCYPDRVLMAQEPGQQQEHGVKWQEVRLPTGEHGWASLEYLAPATASP